jgi:hypothetical protein
MRLSISMNCRRVQSKEEANDKSYMQICPYAGPDNLSMGLEWRN